MKQRIIIACFVFVFLSASLAPLFAEEGEMFLQDGNSKTNVSVKRV